MYINKHKYIQTKYILLILTGLLAYFMFNQVAHAAYKQMFTISAYYSPIEGQTKYVTGSYEGDIRLNGSGVNSADGTPVYPGMIAAPSTYAFGTKMNIPGVGIVAVHDRGGAIVHAGERGHVYDRLDIWMGYGDAGLSRALNWGKRNVEVTVYGIDPSLTENVYLEGFTVAEKFFRTIVEKQNIFKEDLWYGESGDKVEELQEYLTELGYYQGKIDGYYGDAVYKAVMEFQLETEIIERKEEFGAGYLGPRSRREIETAIENRKKEKLPTYNLGKDDTGDDVKKLQQALLDLGYDVEVNGVYDDKTINAVFEFQKENEIIDDESDLGAGFFGPKTFEVLAAKLNDFVANAESNISENIIVQAVYDGFEADLKLGDKGEEVQKLQEELAKINLLRISPTGYYGEVTQNAVYKFQQRKGLVADKNSTGAGIFGPITRNTLNNLLGYRENTKAMMASKTAKFNNEQVMVAGENIASVIVAQAEPQVEEVTEPIIVSELVFGSKGEEVEKLQTVLKQLGFFEGAITTDYYGEVTKEAVINFQIAKGIISSTNDEGAGRVGPQTRDHLNSIL